MVLEYLYPFQAIVEIYSCLYFLICRWSLWMFRFFNFLSFLFLLIFTVSALEFNLDFGDIDENAIPAALLKGANEAYSMNLQGLDELGAGRLDEALSLFKDAAKKIPNYSDAENNIGVVYLRKGNIGIARDMWMKIVKYDPQYATAWYNLGIIADMDGKIDEARSYFKSALEKNSRFSEAYVMLGKIEIKINDFKKSHKYFLKAFELTPSNEMAWGSYAYSLTNIGDTVEAEKILLQHLDHPEALKMLGEIAATQNRKRDAIAYLTEAAAIGEDLSVVGAVAKLKLENQDPCGALIATEEYILKATKPEADLYNLAGIAAKECGDMKKALKLFNEGVKKYPGDAVLKFNCGAILFREGKYKEAYKLLSTISDTLNDPDLYRMRIVSLINNKEEDDALKELDKALSRYPSNSKFYDIKGSILYKRGKKEEAQLAFERALNIDPSNESAKFNLSLCRGEGASLSITSAIATFEEKLSKCTMDCNSPLHNLARLYSFNNQKEKAIELLKGSINKSVETYVLLSKILNEQGKSSESISLLEEAASRFTLTDEAKLELAGAYLSAGVYTKALSLLIQIENSNAIDRNVILYELGYANMKIANYSKAAYYFEKYNGAKMDVPGFLGFIYNELGDNEKAKSSWIKSLDNDPKNPMIWANMGLLLYNQGKYQEAIDHYNKALKLPNAESEILINKALALEAIKKNTNAEKCYRSAFNTSSDKKARYNLALLYISQKKNREAEKISLTLKKNYPNSIEAKRVLGEVFLVKEEYDKAEEVFNSLQYKTAEDYSALARIYMKMGKESKMNYALDNLPKEEKWNSLKKSLRSEIAFTAGNYRDAYQSLKNSNANTFDDRYNLALLAFKSEDYKSAYDSATILMKESSGEDKFNLIKLAGNSAIKLNDWKNSDLWWSHYFELKPFEAMAAYNVAVAAYNMDNIDRAMEYYQKAQGIDSTIKNIDIENKYNFVHKEPAKDSVVLEKLDRMYNDAVELQSAGKADEARDVYLDIIKEDGRYYRAWNNLGAIYGAEGELEKAIDCYKNAVSRRADIIDGYANLVNIYIAIEDLSNAERWLKKGYKLEPENQMLKQLESALDDAKKQ